MSIMASPSSSGTRFQSLLLSNSIILLPVNHSRLSFKIPAKATIVSGCLLFDRSHGTFWRHTPDKSKNEKYLREASLNPSGKTILRSDLKDLADETELVLDDGTFSLKIRHYCKINDLDKAKQILEDMVEQGYRPDIDAFTTLIVFYCNNGKLQKAFEIFDAMRKIRFQPTIRMYNSLLKGLCYVGRVEEAYERLIAMKKDNSVTPDAYSYTAVMDGFCKVGRSEDAMELLDEARKMGLEPNAVMYNTLFDGYCREGRPTKGFSLLKMMKQRNCCPDSITYDTFMAGLLKWGKTREALRVYKEMESIGVEADERISMRLFKSICGKSLEEPDLVEHARQMFDKMTKYNTHQMFDETPKRLNDPMAYSLLIRALCVGGRLDESLECLNQAIELGYVPRTISFNNLIQGLGAEGRIKDALSVVYMMYGHGKIPSRTSYDVLIKQLNRRKMSPVGCALYGAALKRRVRPLRLPQF